MVDTLHVTRNLGVTSLSNLVTALCFSLSRLALLSSLFSSLSLSLFSLLFFLLLSLSVFFLLLFLSYLLLIILVFYLSFFFFYLFSFFLSSFYSRAVSPVVSVSLSLVFSSLVVSLCSLSSVSLVMLVMFILGPPILAISLCISRFSLCCVDQLPLDAWLHHPLHLSVDLFFALSVSLSFISSFLSLSSSLFLVVVMVSPSASTSESMASRISTGMTALPSSPMGLSTLRRLPRSLAHRRRPSLSPSLSLSPCRSPRFCCEASTIRSSFRYLVLRLCTSSVISGSILVPHSYLFSSVYVVFSYYFSSRFFLFFLRFFSIYILFIIRLFLSQSFISSLWVPCPITLSLSFSTMRSLSRMVLALL